MDISQTFMMIEGVEMENAFDEMLMKHARVAGKQQVNQTKIG